MFNDDDKHLSQLIHNARLSRRDFITRSAAVGLTTAYGLSPLNAFAAEPKKGAY
jgi:peptide/nickel transport system substrate-binding protein